MSVAPAVSRPQVHAVTRPPLKLVEPVSESYNGTHLLFRLLRRCHWGPELLNLGWYRFGSPVATIWNCLGNLSDGQRRLVRKAAEYLDIQPGSRVLDVASGRGGSSFVMKCIFPQSEVCGLDLLPEHIELAERIYAGEPGLSFQQGNAQDLPFLEGSFDRVMCCEAAFHFPDRAQFVSEAARVLKPGGKLAIVDFVWKSAEARQTGAGPQSQFCRDNWQWSDLALAEEYLAAGHRAGLQLVKRVDWTNNVTMPVQRMLELNIKLLNHPWGRKLLLASYPLLETFSKADAEYLRDVTRSHGFVGQLSRYEVFVFQKPAG